MASEMDRARETTLAVLRACGVELSFSDLVRCVIKETPLDEATVKASILRLNSEGKIEITPGWTVRSRVMELPVAAAA
jgi:hypothetical protein